MDVLRLIEARIGKWMAYSDFCMNSEMSLPHCRTFWTWVTVAAVIAGLALAGYLAMSFIRGRGHMGEDSSTNGRR
jgi:hypothetical protein